MKFFGSVEEVLDFAIAEEKAAVEFYRDLAQEMDKSWTRQVLENLAMEEVVHEQKLLLVKEQKLLLPAEDKIVVLSPGAYLVEAKSDEEQEYQQVLLLAVEKEKAALKLYTDLAASTENADLKVLFLDLAQEEAKHKMRLEGEYEKYFQKER